MRVVLRLGLLRQVARKRAVPDAGSSLIERHKGRFTDTPLGLLMEFSHHAYHSAPQQAAGCLSPSLGRWILSASRSKPVKPSCVDAEFTTIPLQDSRPVRPCLVVNPGVGRLRLGTIGRNRPAQTISPPLARLPRETNSLCFPALHVVTAACAVRPAHPRRPDHNKDALARP